VLAALADLFVTRGPPAHIRSDNGPEFIAKAVQHWLGRIGVKTLYITPGSPWENGNCESFNGSLRDELLDGEIFYTLAEAKVLIEAWRRHYNTIRPHSSLGYRPPAPEAAAPPGRPPVPLRSTCGRHWRKAHPCTNNQHGPLSGGQSLRLSCNARQPMSAQVSCWKCAFTTQDHLALITPSIPRPRSQITEPPVNRWARTVRSCKSPFARRDLCVSCNSTSPREAFHRRSSPVRCSKEFSFLDVSTESASRANISTRSNRDARLRNRLTKLTSRPLASSPAQQ
jgi:hypothetical protein